MAYTPMTINDAHSPDDYAKGAACNASVTQEINELKTNMESPDPAGANDDMYGDD